MALAVISAIVLRDTIGRKTQGYMLVGCSLMGICTLAVLAVVYALVESSDWVFAGLIEITGFLFGVFLIILLFLGIGSVRASSTKNVSST